MRVIPAADTQTSRSSAITFIRSPRLDPRYEGVKMEAPEPPQRPQTQRFPIAPLLAPVLMGAILYLITRSLTSLAFIALSPLMLIGNAVESRIAGRAAFKKAVEFFRQDIASLVEEAHDAGATEIAARLREHPSTAECVVAAQATTSLLWARRPGEPGFAGDSTWSRPPAVKEHD